MFFPIRLLFRSQDILLEQAGRETSDTIPVLASKRYADSVLQVMGFLALGLNLLFLEETYPPIVLVQKASELRRRTLNWGIHAKQEEIEVDFRELVTKNFSRPLRLLLTEPIVLLLSIYVRLLGVHFPSLEPDYKA